MKCLIFRRDPIVWRDSAGGDPPRFQRVTGVESEVGLELDVDVVGVLGADASQGIGNVFAVEEVAVGGFEGGEPVDLPVGNEVDLGPDMAAGIGIDAEAGAAFGGGLPGHAAPGQAGDVVEVVVGRGEPPEVAFELKTETRQWSQRGAEPEVVEILQGGEVRVAVEEVSGGVEVNNGVEWGRV